MAITDLPILSMLRTRMQWHQERQRVLAENVANADMPELPAARPRAAEIRRRQPASGGTRSRSTRTEHRSHCRFERVRAPRSQTDAQASYEVRPGRQRGRASRTR